MYAVKQISLLALALFSVSSVAKTTTVCAFSRASMGLD